MPVAAAYGAGMVGWRIHTGTTRGTKHTAAVILDSCTAVTLAHFSRKKVVYKVIRGTIVNRT